MDSSSRRVEVETSPAVWHPGTAGARTTDGMIAVRLDDEGDRVDLWSPDRVRQVGGES